MQDDKLTNKIFFLTGGGTGGHIYPCVSILNELKKRGFEEIFYVGNQKNPEFEISKNLGAKFLNVPVFGMPRKVSPKFIKWIILLLISILKCIGYALKYKPDAVFATGGYVSAPMAIAAKILKISYVMHDSDAHPGIVTRNLAPWANAVNLAFDEAEKFMKKSVDRAKIFHFKNPVRDEFFKITKEEARSELGLKDEFVLLIMGGSQGARSINNASIRLIEHFKNAENIKIIHQTGKKNFETVKTQIEEKMGEIPKNLTLRPYFDKMYLPVLAADVVVSRAGSLSISEMLSAKKPSVLVPYPYAAADHQRKNAREIEKLNAAIYIEDDELEEKLTETVEELIQNPEKLAALQKNASSIITENPTAGILDLILKAAKA